MHAYIYARRRRNLAILRIIKIIFFLILKCRVYFLYISHLFWFYIFISFVFYNFTSFSTFSHLLDSTFSHLLYSTFSHLLDFTFLHLHIFTSLHFHFAFLNFCIIHFSLLSFLLWLLTVHLTLCFYPWHRDSQMIYPIAQFVIENVKNINQFYQSIIYIIYRQKHEFWPGGWPAHLAKTCFLSFQIED